MSFPVQVKLRYWCMEEKTLIAAEHTREVYFEKHLTSCDWVFACNCKSVMGRKRFRFCRPASFGTSYSTARSNCRGSLIWRQREKPRLGQLRDPRHLRRWRKCECGGIDRSVIVKRNLRRSKLRICGRGSCRISSAAAVYTVDTPQSL